MSPVVMPDAGYRRSPSLQCGKKRFDSPAEAAREMNIVARRGSPMRPNVYFCERCAAHHWGNNAWDVVRPRRQ
jgi:hypothetical protein